MLSLALALSLAVESPAEPAQVSVGPISMAPMEITPPALLESGQQVAALCKSLMPFDLLPVKGDVIARSREETAHDALREAALEGKYQVKIAAERLTFAPYDAEEQILTLSERAFLAGTGGTFWVWALHDVGLPVRADEAVAERIVQAVKRHTLSLVFVFTLPVDDDGEVRCANVAGSNRYGLGVEPFSWQYLDGDQVVARGGEGGDRPIVTRADGASPRVTVSEPLEGGRGLKSAIDARRKDLEACYIQALRVNPGIDGTYVAEMELRPGVADRVRLAIDSVQDESMAVCVSAVLERVALPHREGTRFAIPIQFELIPPSAPRSE